MELRNALIGAFAVDLPPTIAIDHPTIAGLAAFISSKAPASASQQPAPPGEDSEPPALNLDGIRAAVLAAVGDILGAAAAAMGAGQPLMEAGLDSLGAVELRNALQSRFGVQLPATAVIDYPSVDALTAFVATLVTPAARAVSVVAGARKCTRLCCCRSILEAPCRFAMPWSVCRSPNTRVVFTFALPHDARML